MLGELVLNYRRQLGMTQEELAASAAVSVRSIRKIEMGRVAKPRQSTLRALADAFDLAGAARVLFYRASVEPFEATGGRRPQPAAGQWPSPDQAGEPFVVVAIDTTARRPDDVMYFQVRVRSEAGESTVGPFPVVTADRTGSG